MLRPYQNIYGKITSGKGCSFGAFVDIGTVEFGENCKVQSFVSIPPGWKFGSNVFIGPGVQFANDKYPQAVNGEFKPNGGIVEDNVSIGMGALIGPGVVLKEGCTIGMGAVVVSDCERMKTYVGNPARLLEKSTDKETSKR